MRSLKIAVAVLWLLGASSAFAESWTEFKTIPGYGLAYTHVLEFYLNPQNLSDTGYVSVAEAERDVKIALAYWTNIPGADVQLIYKGLSNKDCHNLNDEINLVCFAPSLVGICSHPQAEGCPKMQYNGLPGKFWQEFTIWIKLTPQNWVMGITGHESGHIVGLDDFLPEDSIIGQGLFWKEGMPVFAYDREYMQFRYPETVFPISATNRIDLPCVKYSNVGFYDAAVILHFVETTPGLFEPDVFKVVKAKMYEVVPKTLPAGCILFQEKKILRINTVLKGVQYEFETEINLSSLELKIVKYSIVE